MNSPDNGHIEIAKTLMSTIAHCNGAVNRWNPMSYNKKHLKIISEKAMIFFNANPNILTNDHILNICDGFEGENKELYGNLEGWTELNNALDEYFEGGMLKQNYLTPTIK
jgi:hypothetical protein